VEGCLSCDVTSGRVVPPGGCVFEDELMRVHHCIGPLNLGTLVAQPKRHVLRVGELTDAEASATGLVLKRAAGVVAELLHPSQVFVGLWSLTAGEPIHLHWVIQPVTRELVTEYGVSGPELQAAIIARGELPDPESASALADQARMIWPT
jgi:diadenosine tetraphosphate (Ap4A) HIT family hydrolase